MSGIIDFLDDTRKAIVDGANNVKSAVDDAVSHTLGANQGGTAQTNSVETVVTSAPNQTIPKGIGDVANMFGITTPQLLLGVGALVVLVVVMRLKK